MSCDEGRLRSERSADMSDWHHLRAAWDSEAILELPVAGEEPPEALDTTELLRLPGLIEVLKEEVFGAVRVRLADKSIHESLNSGENHQRLYPGNNTTHK